MPYSRRMVQLTGGSSFTVTLPKSWAKSQGVKKRSTLLMQVMDDGGLAIYPEGLQPSPGLAEIAISPSPTVERDIVGAYLLGYSLIRIVSAMSLSEKEILDIKKTVRGLAGAEVVEEAPDRIEIQVMLDPEAVTPEKVLRRQHALVLGMVEDAVNSLVERNVSLARTVIQRDEDVDRHYFTLVRIIRSAIKDPQLARKMGQTNISLLDLRVAAKFLEDSGDQAASMARETTKQEEAGLGQEFRTAFLNMGKAIIEIGSSSIEALLSGDPESTQRALTGRRYFVRNGETFLRHLSKATPTSQLYVARCHDILDRICENFADIAELSATPVKSIR